MRTSRRTPNEREESHAKANRRYMYFARRADIEGYPEIGGLFWEKASPRSRSGSKRSRAEKSHAGRFQKGLDNLGKF